MNNEAVDFKELASEEKGLQNLYSGVRFPPRASSPTNPLCSLRCNPAPGARVPYRLSFAVLRLPLQSEQDVDLNAKTPDPFVWACRT